MNPPNLPMFRLGTVPFIGDYIDVAPSPAFVPAANGEWVYNTASNGQMPIFHAVWTDNRDVRPPLDGNWANYTPPTINGQLPGTSLFDPTQQVAVCYAGNAGSRNQNIYTARIGGGLLVGAPGNAKPLSPTVQRGFVVFAQNQTTVDADVPHDRAGPAAGRPRLVRAVPAAALHGELAAAADHHRRARAGAVHGLAYRLRDVHRPEGAALHRRVGSGAPWAARPSLAAWPGARCSTPTSRTRTSRTRTSRIRTSRTPTSRTPRSTTRTSRTRTSRIPTSRTRTSRTRTSRTPTSRTSGSPTPTSRTSAWRNPDIENPDIENPDIENPDIENPDIENGALSDVTWTVSNIGNTTSAFNVNLFLANAAVPAGLKTQLIVYKIYKTPVLAPNGCDLQTETRNVILYNVPNPNFVTPGQGLPDQNDPADTNATLWLNPGEVGRVTLRVFDEDTSNNITVTNLDGSTASIDPAFNPETAVTAAISAQGVDILDPPGRHRAACGDDDRHQPLLSAAADERPAGRPAVAARCACASGTTPARRCPASRSPSRSTTRPRACCSRARPRPWLTWTASPSSRRSR